MGADLNDVLDDCDGGLVWTEIETAITLDEMNISTGASAPVFYWRSNLQYTNVLRFAGAMIFLGFFTDHLDLPPGTPLCWFTSPRQTFTRIRTKETTLKETDPQAPTTRSACPLPK